MEKVRSRGPGGYFEWLIGRVGLLDGIHLECADLLWQLHSIDFRFSIPNDLNRLADGLGLRDFYCEETGVDGLENWPCSVLEVLIRLSERVSEVVDYSDNESDILREWFWRFVENLGLLNYSGNRYDKGRVCSIVEIWLSRSFDPDGTGSPFPLQHPTTDQRRIEIWAQVCAYLTEHEDTKIDSNL